MEDAVENRDIVDNIRIDASTLGPKEANDAKITLDEMSQFLEERFGSYMSDAARKRAATAKNNLVVVDDTTQFLSAFFPEEKGVGFIKEESLEGFYHPPTQIAVVKDQNRLWEDAGSETRATAIRIFGDEETAKNSYGNFMALGTLAHELAHAYIDPQLPKPLQELGAYYLGDQVSKEFFKGISVVDKGIIELYNHFLQKYGADFPRFMFGEHIGAIARFRLSREIRSLERGTSTQRPSAEQPDTTNKPTGFDNFKKTNIIKEINYS